MSKVDKIPAPSLLNRARAPARQLSRSTMVLISTLSLCVLLAGSLSAAEMMTDPTRPPDASERARWTGESLPGTVDFRVEMTLTSPARSLAIVNAQRVQVGDFINNAEVISIETDRVQLDVDGAIREFFVRRWTTEENSTP